MARSGDSRGNAMCHVAFGFTLQNGWSQLNTSTIGGTVTDSSGAVVPDATVTILDEGTQTPNCDQRPMRKALT